MSRIHPCDLPPDALLSRYAGSGGYADCFSAEIDRPVSHAEFVEAFYTGRLFRIERRLIAAFLSRPSSDAQVKELARGERSGFAAWTVEGRATDQLLLCDVAGRTRSWLMVAPVADGRGTRLYFGSAVVAVTDRATGRPRMGAWFGALLGFHKLYSRWLLGSARARLAHAA